MVPSVLDTPITTEEFHSFHGIDRRLYARIVNGLRRDPVQSIQVMAFWLWSEHCGYPNIILKLLSLPDGHLNAIIDEASAVLRCLSSDFPPHPTQSAMPLTQQLTDGLRISLSIFYQIRVDAMSGIAIKVNNVCIRAFEDIAIPAMERAERERERARLVQFPVAQQRHAPHPGQFSAARPIPIPFYGQGSGFPCGPFVSAFAGGVPPSPQMERGESSRSANINPTARPWTVTDEVPADDRTMFLTFSRGYPITEDEVKSFFEKRFGDCVERIIMQEVPPFTQPLFARVVLYSAAKIPEILGGREKVKFSIFGKHVWARQYVTK